MKGDKKSTKLVTVKANKMSGGSKGKVKKAGC